MIYLLRKKNKIVDFESAETLEYSSFTEMDIKNQIDKKEDLSDFEIDDINILIYWLLVWI